MDGFRLRFRLDFGLIFIWLRCLILIWLRLDFDLDFGWISIWLISAWFRFGFGLDFGLDFGWIWIWLSFITISLGFDLIWFDFGWVLASA